MDRSDKLAAMRMFLGDLERIFIENRDAIEGSLRKFAEWMDQAAAQAKEAARVQAELYPKLRAEMGPLAKRGWFISGNFGMSEIMALAHQCGTLNDAELDAVVAEMYRSSLDEHGKWLAEHYPERAFAIKPALDAHHRQEYALSVPIFFAHAEGISFDATQKYLFKNGKAKGGVDENIKAAAKEQLDRAGKPFDPVHPFDTLSIFMEIMWLPLAEPFPIGYNLTDREKHNYTGLNRNTVMHGLDKDYATEENSLKAFSLLSHVGSLLQDSDERGQGDSADKTKKFQN